MPRLRPEFTETPFFLYAKSPITGAVEDTPSGSGFAVQVASETLPLSKHCYAVSCKHVVSGSAASIIGLAHADGSPAFPEYEPTDWTFSKDDDLAVIDITDDIEAWSQPTAICVAQSDLLLDSQFIERCNVGIGDEVVMLGLFPDHPSEPVARFGSLAAMASDEHPLRLHKHDKPRPAFMADMRSRAGFSGSIVVVYRTPTTNLRNISSDSGFTYTSQNNAFFRILGVHRGQFWETITARATEATPRKAFADGDKIDIASSMTYIVPAWRIAEMLESEQFRKRRAQRDEEPARIKRYARTSGEEGA